MVFQGFSRVIKRCLKHVSRVILESFKGVFKLFSRSSKEFQASFNRASKKFHGNFKGVPRNFHVVWDCLKFVRLGKGSKIKLIIFTEFSVNGSPAHPTFTEDN